MIVLRDQNRNALIEANLGLALSLARMLCRTNPAVSRLGVEDAEGAAWTGLCIAAEYYRPPGKFSIYARRRIIGEVKNAALRCPAPAQEGPERSFEPTDDLERKDLQQRLLSVLTGFERRIIERHFGLTGQPAMNVAEIAAAEKRGLASVRRGLADAMELMQEVANRT